MIVNEKTYPIVPLTRFLMKPLLSNYIYIYRIIPFIPMILRNEFYSLTFIFPKSYLLFSTLQSYKISYKILIINILLIQSKHWIFPQFFIWIHKLILVLTLYFICIRKHSKCDIKIFIFARFLSNRMLKVILLHSSGK